MIVIDTNVIIAALYSKKGASFKLLELCLNKKIDFAVSSLVFLEYRGKISNKIEDNFLKINKRDLDIFLKAIYERAELILHPIILRPMLPDPGDDKILECAISANAESIISFNTKDFPRNILSEYGIKLMSPKTFLKKEGLI